ncbi:hypothetical protein L6Q96_06535 [Candidatus Binatia bacterium]|nr:hypothetical protein [Candidatus Binatia bacterium]
MRDLRWCVFVFSLFSAALPAAGQNPNCPTAASTFELIQKGIFEKHGCDVAYCHGETKLTNLDMRAGASYADLVNRPAITSLKGLDRIEPGQPDQSHLYRVMDYRTNDLKLYPGEPIPVGRPRINREELEGVRLWILAGAPKTGIVPGVANRIDLCERDIEAYYGYVPPCEPGDPDLLLPDLISEAPRDVRVSSRDGKHRITFTASIANVGQGPLIIQPAFLPTGPGAIQAMQVINKRDGKRCARPAGEIIYSASGAHWRYDNIIDYELRKGDPVTGQVVGLVAKSTNCLVDAEQVRGWRGGHQFEAHCEDDLGRMGISVGFKDVYRSSTDGQTIEVDADPDTVPSGSYYLVTVADPTDVVWETNNDRAANSASYRLALRTTRPRPGSGGPPQPTASATGIVRPPRTPTPGDPGQGDCRQVASTYELIQRGVFERQSCNQAICHGENRGGELDLRAPGSYADLLDEAVGINGMRLVEPGAPERSMLWLKLAARTLGRRGVPGVAMPVGGMPTSPEALDVIRLWILAGAPEHGMVPGTADRIDPCPPPPSDGGDEDLPVCRREDPDLLLPELTVEPPKDVRTLIRFGHRRIEFTTSVVNTGDGPLIIQAAERSESPPTDFVPAEQVILRRDGSKCARPAGSMWFTGSGGHWSYGHVVNYELRKDDPMTGDLMVLATKSAYCLLDTDPIRYADGRLNQFEAHCTDTLGRMGISVGFKDVYERAHPAQWIDLDGDPEKVIDSGNYYLVNVVNPANMLWEKDDSRESNVGYVNVGVPFPDPDGPGTVPTVRPTTGPSPVPTVTAQPSRPTRPDRPTRPIHRPRPTRPQRPERIIRSLR